MKRPQEHKYSSLTAYTRALEDYCTLLENTTPVPFKPPAKWRDDEIANGYIGIRWVGADGVYGRPTQEDVESYLGYTQPKREWHGLTTGDAKQLVEDKDWYNDPVGFCFEVEAKLKEKNHAQ